MNSRNGLALFCGIYLVVFKLGNSKNFISENMKADIENLTVYFNISGDLGLFGNSIFLKYLHSQNGNTEVTEKKLLVQEILDVYITILSNMMHHIKDSHVNSSIARVKGRLEELRSSYFHQEEHLLKKRLQNLWAMKVNDLTVQRKAVRELIPVFQKVSILLHREGTHRKKTDIN